MTRKITRKINILTFLVGLLLTFVGLLAIYYVSINSLIEGYDKILIYSIAGATSTLVGISVILHSMGFTKHTNKGNDDIVVFPWWIF